MQRITIAFLAALCILSTLAGCTSSNGWRQFYQPSRSQSPISIGPRDTVEVRVASISQFADAGNALRAYYDQRRMAPEDGSAEDGRATRQLLLDALRVPLSANSTAILGFSGFNSSEAARPDDPNLLSFAKSVGADIVVIGWEYAGQRTGYTSVPVMSNTYSNATATAYGRGGMATAYASGYSNTMTMVPVQTTIDQWTTVAWFIRKVSPEERATLDTVYKKHP